MKEATKSNDGTSMRYRRSLIEGAFMNETSQKGETAEKGLVLSSR